MIIIGRISTEKKTQYGNQLFRLIPEAVLQNGKLSKWDTDYTEKVLPNTEDPSILIFYNFKNTSELSMMKQFPDGIIIGIDTELEKLHYRNGITNYHVSHNSASILRLNQLYNYDVVVFNKYRGVDNNSVELLDGRALSFVKPEYSEYFINEVNKIIEKRQIKSLFHFTKISRIEGIINNGLLCSKELPDECLNDTLRYENVFDLDYLDETRNYVSVSIGFPNYRMFYRLRQNDKNSNEGWIVLKIDPSIITHRLCLFCSHNASDRSSENVIVDQIRNNQNSNSDANIGFFEKMFAPDEKHDRSIIGEFPCYPTDPQAEVLVYHSIPPSYIEEIVFSDKKTMDSFLSKTMHSSFIMNYEQRLFDSRIDYKEWSTTNLNNSGDSSF